MYADRPAFSIDPDRDAGPARDFLWGLPDPDRQGAFYAGVPTKRALAWLADTVLVTLLTLIAVPLTAFVGLFFLPLLFVTIGFVYRWSTIAGGSATWGMRLMGIEFRDRNGRRFDSGMAFLHTLGFVLIATTVIPQILSAGLMLTQPRGQGLHDLVLGTTAINRPA